MKKWLWITGGILFVLLLLFLFRFSILRGLGSYLLVGNAPAISEVMFVLSGAPVERGQEAVRLYKAGWVKKIVCTGGNKPQDFAALGMDYYESQLTKSEIVLGGVPDSAVQVINEGTSTLEERDVVLNYCLSKNIRSCIIVSSAFHTRRVRSVFTEKLEEKNIHPIVCGAPSILYQESKWWENEYGLLAVNNEYVKLIYYAVK